MKRVRNIWFGLIVSVVVVTVWSCAPRHSRETPIVRVVKDHAEAVVNIRTESITDLRENPYWGLYGEQLDLFFKQYFGEAYSEGTLKHKSIGSGVIMDASGLVVTNAHVVQKATRIFVVLNDGTMSEARVQEVSEGEDLAIIQTDFPRPVKPVKAADIDNLMIGETVVAIGNPLGLENSVTTGVISGKDRSFSSSQCGYVCSGLLQTDASINPGNSGGALLNLDGELVGINLAVVQNAQNIGFAIPVDRIQELLERVRSRLNT
jgi:serine protease Do